MWMTDAKGLWIDILFESMIMALVLLSFSWSLFAVIQDLTSVVRFWRVSIDRWTASSVHMLCCISQWIQALCCNSEYVHVVRWTPQNRPRLRAIPQARDAWCASELYRLCEEPHNVKIEEPHNGTGYVKNLRISASRLCVEPQNRCRLRVAPHKCYKLCDVHQCSLVQLVFAIITWRFCIKSRWHSNKTNKPKPVNKRKPVNPYVVMSYYIRWDAIPWYFTLTQTKYILIYIYSTPKCFLRLC